MEREDLTSVSDQERASFELLAYWFDNPGAAAFDLFADPASASGRLELQPHQIDVIANVLAGRDVTWRAGHGVGKTTTVAVLVFLWLLFKPFSLVPTTAPTWHQVRNVLWAEIAKWYERFKFRSALILDKTKLSMAAYPNTWRAIGVASNRSQNIEGFHSANLLFIGDEAKGIPNPIFDAMDGALSEGGQRIYTSTPGSRFGKFYESHHGRISRYFKVIHTNGEDVARVARKYIELKRMEWGVDSPIYISKVRGDFPQEGDDVLYPLSWIDAAAEAFLEVVCENCKNTICGSKDDSKCKAPKLVAGVKHGPKRGLGCDVARFGFNQTVTMAGSVHRLDRLTAWERKPTTETTARILDQVREDKAAGAPIDVIAIDDSGLGGGVTDQLREAGQHVAPVLFGGSTSDDGKEYFANWKAEHAWKLRKALDENRQAREIGGPGTLAIVPNDKLKGQMSSMRRRYGGKGVLSIVDPDDPSIPATELAPGMKVSPDHAHAAIITFYACTEAVAESVGYVDRPDDDEREQGRRRLSNYIFNRASRGPLRG